MKFIDQAKIHIQSGPGGNGCCSFRREKYIPNGGPNGGDGAKGGDIYIQANPHLNTLIDFRHKVHFKAQKGGHGQGSNRTGRAGEDLILQVPLGTQVFDETGTILLTDVIDTTQRICLAKGGDGGKGNARFKTSVNQAPRYTESGQPAEERWIVLKLKVMADIGIIGLPNAGKSTLLKAATRANPKIADYPFTTLIPQLGVLLRHDREIVLADIPGLIENAHLGHGLGHQFLAHIERCRCLLHMIDATTEDIVGAYKLIRRELKEYGANIDQKQEIIALNKSELVDSEEMEQKVKELTDYLSGHPHERGEGNLPPIFVISALTRQGLEPLYEILEKYLQGSSG